MRKYFHYVHCMSELSQTHFAVNETLSKMAIGENRQWTRASGSKITRTDVVAIPIIENMIDQDPSKDKIKLSAQQIYDFINNSISDVWRLSNKSAHQLERNQVRKALQLIPTNKDELMACYILLYENDDFPLDIPKAL